MSRSLPLWISLLAAACGPSTPPPITIPNPPQVFLTLSQSTVVGDRVPGKVNVSGCSKVTQVQILQRGEFLADANYRQSPTDFELPASLFSSLYGTLGIAIPLTLSAKVVCDDGRTNDSAPVGVTFFPVATVVSKAGEQVLHDSFIAIGGANQSPTNFLGCSGTKTGTALVLVNAEGEVLKLNEALPFDCSYATEISERSRVTGTRWVLEPGKGAYALNDNLAVTAQYAGPLDKMGVGSTGAGVFLSVALNSEAALRLNPLGGTRPIVWSASAVGKHISTPVVNESENVVIIATWQFHEGTKDGDIVIFKFDAQTGALVNGVPPVGGPPAIFSQKFPQLNKPIPPAAALNRDGTLIVLAVISAAVDGLVRTTVLSCSTQPKFGGCLNSDRRWASEPFDGVLNLVVPMDTSNTFAAAGPYQAWFLDAKNGAIRNLGNSPLRPSGSLQFVGVQPGLGTEFYLVSSSAADRYPLEIVATDKPESGELWRFSQGTGESPQAGLYPAVDEGGQVWLRVGPDLVKPLPNAEYRSRRGATLLPDGGT